MIPGDPPRRNVSSVNVLVVRPEGAVARPDSLATEEPLEIRAGWPGRAPETVAVTMRTPGHDFELAVGFLLAEGVVGAPGDVAAVRYCVAEGQEQRYNLVSVDLTGPADLALSQHPFLMGSSCGICGTTSLEALERRCRPVTAAGRLAASRLVALPDQLRRSQPVFERTGGLHAAGIFTLGGEGVAVREDIGRHNAVDKLTGWAALGHELPLVDRVLVVSGRLSFEIVQKAAVAGVGILVAVSAPSSLAVRTADRLGITLAAFVRNGRANVYTHPERIELGR